MVIAVDFDETLCRNAFPNIENAIQDECHKRTTEWLLYRQSLGDKLILWTCRENHLFGPKHLRDAKEYGERLGIKWYGVNSYKNPCFKKQSRKVSVDLYIDDKAVNPIELMAWDKETKQFEHFRKDLVFINTALR